MSVQIPIKEFENIKGIYKKLYDEHEEVKELLMLVSYQLLTEKKENKQLKK